MHCCSPNRHQIQSEEVADVVVNATNTSRIREVMLVRVAKMAKSQERKRVVANDATNMDAVAVDQAAKDDMKNVDARVVRRKRQAKHVTKV